MNLVQKYQEVNPLHKYFPIQLPEVIIRNKSGGNFMFPSSKLVENLKRISSTKRDMRKKFIKSDFPTYKRIRKVKDGTKIYGQSFQDIEETPINSVTTDSSPSLVMYNHQDELDVLANVKSYEDNNQLLKDNLPSSNLSLLPISYPISKEIKQNNFNIDRAVNFLTSNAKSNSTGFCARSVRMALEHGGLNIIGRPRSAFLYNNYLPKLGFKAIGQFGYTGNKLPEGYTPQKGDIVVIGATKKHPHGHISMYNGEQWISDFKLKTFHGLKDAYAQYTIWRHI